MLETYDYIRRETRNSSDGVNTVTITDEDTFMKIVTPCEYVNTLMDKYRFRAQKDRTRIRFTIDSPVSILKYSFELEVDTIKITAKVVYTYGDSSRNVFETKTTYERVDKYLFDCIEHGYKTGQRSPSYEIIKCGNFNVHLVINYTGMQMIIHSIRLWYGMTCTMIPVIKYCEDDESVSKFLLILQKIISSFRLVDCEHGQDVYHGDVKCETNCLCTEVTNAIDTSSARQVKRVHFLTH